MQFIILMQSKIFISHYFNVTSFLDADLVLK